MVWFSHFSAATLKFPHPQIWGISPFTFLETLPTWLDFCFFSDFFFVSWCSPLNLTRSPTHSRYKLLSRANYASRTWLSSSESTLFCCFFGDGYAKGDDRPLLQHFSPSNSLVFYYFCFFSFSSLFCYFLSCFSSLHHTDQIDHILFFISLLLWH